MLECAPGWACLRESKPTIFIDVKALMGCSATNGPHGTFGTCHKLHFVIITKIALLHKQMLISFLHGVPYSESDTSSLWNCACVFGCIVCTLYCGVWEMDFWKSRIHPVRSFGILFASLVSILLRNYKPNLSNRYGLCVCTY